MFPNTLYKSYHFADFSHITAKPHESPTRHITSSHIHLKPLLKTPAMFHQKSEIFTTVESSCNQEYSIQIRGLNEDNLETEEVWDLEMFQKHLLTLTYFSRTQLLRDVFKYIKRWFLVYGLVSFRNSLFLLRKRSELTLLKTYQESHSLIIYLSKKQLIATMMLTNQQKEQQLIEQFLIMFGNFLFEGQKMNFPTFAVFEQFLQKLIKHHFPSMNSSNFLGSETYLSQKNLSMTASHIEYNQSLAYAGFRPKVIEKSMMIIEENSSEHSSPKKFITTSGFMDLKLSNVELPRQEICLSVGKSRVIVQKKSFGREGRVGLTHTRTNLISMQSSSPDVLASKPSSKKITFNYISPEQPENLTSTLPRQLSNVSFQSKKMLPCIQLRLITPPVQKNEFFTFKLSSQNLHKSQPRQERKSISDSNIPAPINDNIAQHIRSSSIEKQVNSREASNLKLTATTLNTYQNTSSNYISHHSFHKSNLRNSGSSDHFYLFNNSPNNHHNENIDQTSFETRQRKYSHFDTKQVDSLTQNQNDYKLYGTTHQLNFTSINIFDVQEVEETNKSEEKFNKISEESNNCTERNSYSINDIQNELDNLFGDSENSEKNQAEIDQMIEEFENLLLD